jgi:hypothetical protein
MLPAPLSDCWVSAKPELEPQHFGRIGKGNPVGWIEYGFSRQGAPSAHASPLRLRRNLIGRAVPVGSDPMPVSSISGTAQGHDLSSVNRRL